MKTLIWLTSYPKSGNTWVRAFLSCILNNGNDININKLLVQIAANRDLIEGELCIETSELSMDEIEVLRPLAFTSLADSAEATPFFIKVHDAYTYTIEGTPIFPKEVSAGVIYIVRNPLDVACSFAHHNNVTIDEIIKIMNDADSALSGNKNTAKLQVRQKLLTWGQHVKSWLEQKDIPVLLVKYEELTNNPQTAFKSIVQFSGLNYTDADINVAIDRTIFPNLQALELSSGFREKTTQSERFFRKGKIGSWREEMNEEQIQKIIAGHREVMQSLGYIDHHGNLLV